MSNRGIGILDPACPVNWAHPLNRGLVGWWMVPPNVGWRGGLTFRDLTRGGRRPIDGAMGSTPPTWVGAKGRPGGFGALEFVGGVTQPITVADDDRWTRNRLSFAIWFRQTIAALNYCLMTKGDGATNANSSLALIRYSAIGSNNLGFWVNNGSGWATAFSDAEYGDSKWHQAVGTFDSSTVTIFIDGFQRGTAIFSGSMPNDTNAFILGRHNSVGVADFDGQIDDTRWYDRCLGPGEILNLYKQSRRGHPDTLNWLGRRSFVTTVEVAGAATRLLSWNTTGSRSAGGLPVSPVRRGRAF